MDNQKDRLIVEAAQMVDNYTNANAKDVADRVHFVVVACYKQAGEERQFVVLGNMPDHDSKLLILQSGIDVMTSQEARQIPTVKHSTASRH